MSGTRDGYSMNWTWFHKLGSPKWFYGISSKFLPWLSIAALLLIGVGVVWGLAFWALLRRSNT